MTSITGWNRIEPVARDQSFREGLEAPIYDPAWTLARQWQVGEFRGEDAASAVNARMRVRSRPVTHFIPGHDTPGLAHDRSLPLESLVEAETATEFGPLGWLERSEAGLAFLRLLRAQAPLPEERTLWIAERGFPALGADEAAALTDEERADYDELRESSPDGLQLAPYLEALLAGTEPPPPPYAGQTDALQNVARRWLEQWRRQLVISAGRPSSWQPSRLEYAFALGIDPAGASDGTRLEAREYHGGAINWDDFDIRHGTDAPDDDTGLTEISSIPMPLEFAGMPAPRWWEFEDGRLALPQIEAAPDDLIKLVLVDFALVYGGDWLIMPLDLQTGAVHRIENLTVTDTFGQKTRIAATASTSDDPLRDWTMHNLSENRVTLASRTEQQSQVMFLPPVSAGTLNGMPRETVNIGRDEVANLALARERTVTGPLGTRIDREQEYRLRQPPAPSRDGTISTRYRLAEKVPDYWIPLVPELTGNGPAIHLRRGTLLDPETGQPVPPKGRILVPGEKLLVEEEEISSIGMTIHRLFRLARGTQGETVLWPARMRKPSKADQTSGGVGFDLLKDE